MQIRIRLVISKPIQAANLRFPWPINIVLGSGTDIVRAAELGLVTNTIAQVYPIYVQITKCKENIKFIQRWSFSSLIPFLKDIE